MQSSSQRMIDEIDPSYLGTIGGIKFSRRETEVLSCLTQGQPTKKIASLLSLSPKTVATHIHNVMLKLDVNSRERIIDFIQKSPEFPQMNDYFKKLLTLVSLKKVLHAIAKRTSISEHVGVTIHCEDLNNPLISQLSNQLKLAGIRVSSTHKIEEIKDNPLKSEGSERREFHIHFIFRDLPQQVVRKLLDQDKTEKNLILIFADNAGSFQELDDEKCITLNTCENYYCLVFTLLKRLLPHVYFDDLIINFNNSNEPTEYVHPTQPPSTGGIKFQDSLKASFSKIRLSVWLLSLICCLGLFTAFAVLKNNKIIVDISESNRLRSDLIIPNEKTLLDRSELFKIIDANLHKQNGIQNIALIGVGGAGKTTIARQYARLQNASITWEINAETHESLTDSYENLALALAQTDQEKKTLHGIRDIKEANEREAQILSFVKSKLSSYKNWFLIFDNVERFSDIQKHYPHDPINWGNGKIILTTRDEHIQSNNPINASIHIGELTPTQQLMLFTRIISQGRPQQMTKDEFKEAQEFMRKIPPFPLDVSVAAYYIKSANIPYTQYLERLKNNNQSFIALQENVIKQESDYARTRYGIITLALQDLIEAHPDFKDLLLFISLLDSQDIPRELLDLHKSDIVTDNFIYYLKKFSLITRELPSSVTSISTFSIHRSTQEVILSYITNILNTNENKTPVDAVSLSLKRYLEKAADTGSFEKMKLIANHCLTFLTHESIIKDKFSRRIKIGLGCLYYYFDDYKKTEYLLESSIEKLSPRNREDYADTAEALVYLGIAKRELGNYKKAQELLEKGFKIYKDHLPEEQLATAWALTHLGNVYREFGDYHKSEKILLQSSEIYRRHTNEKQGKFCWTLLYLGDIYRSLGKHKQANAYYHESYLINKKLYGKNHLRTAKSLVYLANSHTQLGDYTIARDFFEESLTIYKTCYAEDHSRIAWIYVYLGNTYKLLKNYSKAEDLLNKALKINLNYYGENNIKTAWNSVYLGDLYTTLGYYNKAKMLLERSLKIHRTHYGEKHPKIAWILACMAKTYEKLGRRKESKALLENSHAIYKNHFGEGYLEPTY